MSDAAHITAGTPALLLAVRATVGTVETRRQVYRVAILSIAVAALSPLVLALVFLSWRPLPYLVMLVPLVGAFLVADGRAVLRWQRRVLDLWRSSDMKFEDLRQTIKGIRHLPAQTVSGMLERLPAPEREKNLEPHSPHSRGCIAARCLEQAERHDRVTWLWTSGTTLVAGSVATALSSQAVLAPLVIGFVGLLVIVSTRFVAPRDRIDAN